MRWVWDSAKDRSNRAKHGLSFDTARLVFEDPLALSHVDPHRDGERWQTVGTIGAVVVLVVHTWPDRDDQAGEDIGRIISARRATARERRAYEEGGI